MDKTLFLLLLVFVVVRWEKTRFPFPTTNQHLIMGNFTLDWVARNNDITSCHEMKSGLMGLWAWGCSLQLLLWISQMCSVKNDNKMMDQSVSAHWLSVRVVGFLFVRDSRCIALKTDKGPENTTHFDPNYLIWSVVGGFDWWIEQISSGISYFLEFWVIRWVDNNFTWLT